MSGSQRMEILQLKEHRYVHSLGTELLLMVLQTRKGKHRFSLLRATRILY